MSSQIAFDAFDAHTLVLCILNNFFKGTCQTMFYQCKFCL